MITFNFKKKLIKQMLELMKYKLKIFKIKVFLT
jgi:hypothetical protein